MTETQADLPLTRSLIPAKRSDVLPAILSALLAIALYAVSIGGTYVYDDIDILKRDDRIQDPAKWGQYWTTSYNHSIDRLYRPLVSVSYAVQWWMNGDRPWLFHLVNVLLHGAVCACVAELTRRLLGSSPGLVAGLLFAAHPIHVEAVANIVGRAELLCALGFFGALVLFLKPLTTARVLSITGCFLLALLSKEQGMLVPATLLILAMLRRTSPGPRGSVLLLSLLLCWLLAGYIVWREQILPFWWDRELLDWTINPMATGRYNPHGGSVGPDRFLMPIVLFGRYVALLVAPLKLSIDYGSKIIGWHVNSSNPYLYVGIASAVACVMMLGLAIRKRLIAVAFAGAGFALAYAMVSNALWLIGTIFAERLMYIPSAFFLILVTVAITRFPKPLLIGLTSVLLCLASIRTVSYEMRWDNRLAFYDKSLKDQPESIKLHMLLAEEYRQRGNLAEAARVAQAGRELLPEYWDIWVQSAHIAMDQGKFDDAQEYLNRARQIRPSSYVEAWTRELWTRRAAAATSRSAG